MPPPDSAGPGLAPPDPEGAGSEQFITVGREWFRVRLRPRRGPRYECDYDWPTGPNIGYRFGVSGPFEHSEDDHKAQIRDFLADIDPSAGLPA
jgi:hypothetical protein